MIYGNLKQMAEYVFLEEKVRKCLDYAQTHDLAGYEKGIHKIDEDRFYVNVSEYETTTEENRIWEAHKKYLDVHLVLRGSEQIDLNFVQNMQEEPFVEEKDLLPLQGTKKASVCLSEGDFLVCYPNDAHRTAILIGQPEKIKKAIFKVLL